MVKGIAFALFVWFTVTIGIMIFTHLTNTDKMNVVKALRYGFVTAILSFGVLVAVVQLF